MEAMATPCFKSTTYSFPFMSTTCFWNIYGLAKYYSRHPFANMVDFCIQKMVVLSPRKKKLDIIRHAHVRQAIEELV